MNTVFLHLRNTPNIGDRWCSPFDWFDWPNTVEVRDLRSPGPSYDIGIYGGGRIFGGLATYAGVNGKHSSLHVAWGVGTHQSFPISLRYSRARQLCDLVGSRDYGDKRYTWSPCASCMAPQFDSPPAAKYNAVFYCHAGKMREQKISIPETMPKLSNNCGSLDEALSFIASGETVISNSYHGVYWGLLMGRKAICIPFSRKFSSYPEAPYYTTPKDWINNLDKGVARPNMLEICRVATLGFKNKVEALIAMHSHT